MSRRHQHPSTLRRLVPACERLETISLLSTVTQTLTLPAGYTNINNAPLSAPLQLFNPALGTLTDVKVSTAVTVSTTLQGENTSLSETAVISGSISGSDQINGLSQTVSGTVSASSPDFQAATFDGTLDYAGSSGVTFHLSPVDSQSSTLTGASDLAFYTATPSRGSIVPTATIQATLTENASSGNTQYQAATLGSAVVTVTYDYTPNPSPRPGASASVPFPRPKSAEGKASSHLLGIHPTGSNAFGRPLIHKPPISHAPTSSKPDSGSPKIHKPIVPAPHAPAHPLGFFGARLRSGFVRR